MMMPMQTKPTRKTPAERMAEVLAETVAEISNRTSCRTSLAFAGFDDDEITRCLPRAQRKAREMRVAEIERRVARQRK